MCILALKLSSLLLGVLLVIVPLGIRFERILNLLPSYRKAISGLKKLYAFNDELSIKDRNNNDISVSAGILQKGDVGFKQMRHVINVGGHYGLYCECDAVILAKSSEATNVDWGTGVIIPGELLFVRDDGELHPLMRDPREHRILEHWIIERAHDQVALIVVALAILWTMLNVLIFF